METHVSVDVYFKEEVEYKFKTERIFNILSPLSLYAHEDIEPNLSDAVGKFGGSNENHRMECLTKMYDQSFLESAKLVSPYHVKLNFISGSDGFDFSEDFSFVMFQMGATKVTASLGYDEDEGAKQTIIFELDREQICKNK